MKVLGYVNPDTILAEVSSPPYPEKHSGVCLIVGTHPCWEQDVEAARRIAPNADVCAVNEAVKLIKADHVATSHEGRIQLFASQHLARWGSNHQHPEFHFRSPQFKELRKDAFAWDVTVGAGSAPFAAAVMTLIGYDMAIFCGCPMDGGGGYAMTETHKSTLDDPRFGLIDKNHLLVQSWKVALRNMPERIPTLTKKWRSMSGYTQQIFGGP